MIRIMTTMMTMRMITPMTTTMMLASVAVAVAVVTMLTMTMMMMEEGHAVQRRATSMSDLGYVYTFVMMTSFWGMFWKRYWTSVILLSTVSR
jgi:hypothetical protein